MIVPYLTFMKHAEVVVKPKSLDSRPVLKGVYHAEDGSLVVTDSYRLYKATNAQDRKDGAIIHPKTGELIDGNYPDTSRLITDNEPQFTASISVDEALKALKALKACGQVHDKKVIAKITLNDDRKATISVDTPIIDASYYIGEGELLKSDADREVVFNLQYVIDALAMFKDAGVPNVTFHAYGKSPFIIKQNDDLIALILPIRIY